MEWSTCRKSNRCKCTWITSLFANLRMTDSMNILVSKSNPSTCRYGSHFSPYKHTTFLLFLGAHEKKNTRTLWFSHCALCFWSEYFFLLHWTKNNNGKRARVFSPDGIHWIGRSFPFHQSSAVAPFWCYFFSLTRMHSQTNRSKYWLRIPWE